MWNIIVAKLAFGIFKPTLRKHRKKLVNKLTEGHLDPLQQMFLNAIISQIIDIFIEQESTFPDMLSYDAYVRKLKTARTIMQATFGIINIVQYHAGSPDITISNNVVIRKIDVDTFKKNVMDNVDKVIDILDTTTGDIGGEPDAMITDITAGMLSTMLSP